MQYGGGRNIKPGQKLETDEERIARETKTKKLLDDYKKKLGLDMSPKDRARCERVSIFPSPVASWSIHSFGLFLHTNDLVLKMFQCGMFIETLQLVSFDEELSNP